MSARERCLMAHPHPGRECRDPREVYRNRWGGAPAHAPVEPVDGQLEIDEPSDPGGTLPS